MVSKGTFETSDIRIIAHPAPKVNRFPVSAKNTFNICRKCAKDIDYPSLPSSPFSNKKSLFQKFSFFRKNFLKKIFSILPHGLPSIFDRKTPISADFIFPSDTPTALRPRFAGVRSPLKFFKFLV